MHWPRLDSVSIVQGHTLVRITTMTVSTVLGRARTGTRDQKKRKRVKKEREESKEGVREEEEKKRG